MSVAQPNPSGVLPSGTLLDQPHHDGSARYQPDPPQEHGDPFTVLLRTSRQACPSRVVVRTVVDGEAELVPAEIAAEDDHEVWWKARLVAHNSPTHYRFLTDLGPNRYRWVTAAGTADADLPDSADFRVALGDAPPAWLDAAVAYQIFPDRFSRGSADPLAAPPWAWAANWDDPVDLRRGSGARQLYGGDLVGIAGHLDHVAALGANLLYLTPVFPAESNHRYNATSFGHVDPLLGGDRAYRGLIDEVHARGMRIIGDLTTNHTGSGHEWFTGAGAQRDYYYHDASGAHVGWLGHRSLPKLDLGNPALRERFIAGPESVVARWLAFGLDGWRIDVANMTGRYGAADHNQAVARAIRATMRAANPEAYLVAEHFWDALADLDGTGWQGIMNYSGFASPLWTWLVPPPTFASQWSSLPRLPGESVATTMRAFAAAPWPARRASLNLVGSHDTPRIARLVSDRGLLEPAFAALFCYPGVPMVYSGDEIGLTGREELDNRQPFPWQHPSAWDQHVFGLIRTLAAVRRDSSALRRGGLRWAYADPDRLAWLREDTQETVLVFLARRAGEPVTLSAASLGLGEGQSAQNLYGGASLSARQGLAELPGSGPTAQIWRLPEPRWAPGVEQE
ncbi:MAG: glycoside hydrolase family 13 protein [Candidatus Nanopelagicales bacterium]